MRLAGQAKMGFYPANPMAVEEVLKYLRKPITKPTILDPCAGAGCALRQISEALDGIPYAIELDEGRAAECQQRIGVDGKGYVVAPASFFGCTITYASFSLAWVNPPYDDEVGGGQRVEQEFLLKATQLIKPGGILCFVIPEHVSQRWDVKNTLSSWYTKIHTVPFPDEVRKYNEIVIMGVRRARAIDHYDAEAYSAIEEMHTLPKVEEPYDVPPGVMPKRFEKIYLTDAEVAAEFANSPLALHLEPQPDDPLPAPPLPLHQGHLALLLAAGHLDGVVRPEGEPPHVVRGTAHKNNYISNTEEVENADGSTTLKVTQSEKIILTVRVAEQDGTITTLQQE